MDRCRSTPIHRDGLVPIHYLDGFGPLIFNDGSSFALWSWLYLAPRLVGYLSKFLVSITFKFDPSSSSKHWPKDRIILDPKVHLVSNTMCFVSRQVWIVTTKSNPCFELLSSFLWTISVKYSVFGYPLQCFAWFVSVDACSYKNWNVLS